MWHSNCSTTENYEFICFENSVPSLPIVSLYGVACSGDMELAGLFLKGVGRGAVFSGFPLTTLFLKIILQMRK